MFLKVIFWNQLVSLLKQFSKYEWVLTSLILQGLKFEDSWNTGWESSL